MKKTIKKKTKTTTKRGPAKSKTIKVDYLARVEGEGALYIKIVKDQVKDVKLKIFEPPRFFEAFLKERDFKEAPDITARICGICPVAYQMSAVHAMEDALGVKVTGSLRQLRRLIYCGEWIESHTLHITMLHAPDFLGYASSLELAKDQPEIVKRGLKLKKAGNQIISTLGGREVHPINVKVGGFYRVPTRQELKPLRESMLWAQEAALQNLEWVSGFDFPEFTQDYEFVSLKHPEEYPFNEGKIISNKGLEFTPQQFEDQVTEEHIEHSNALHAVLRGKDSYFVGPMARYNLNFEKLSPMVQKAAHSAGLGSTCLNPFKSILVRSVEVLHACEEAIRLIDNYQEPNEASAPIKVKAGKGFACTEAPRGILFQGYQIKKNGSIEWAKIVPPTSQNQKTIEKDLYHFVPQYVDLPKDKLQWKCEQAVRNYDPCISCATHFLKLNLERE